MAWNHPVLMRWEKTYEMVADPPAAMPWEEYERRATFEWRRLLGATPDESTIQKFLESHPALVPGAYHAVGRLTDGHGPFRCAVVTQPPLHGLETRTPDFVWISRDSSFLNPLFIELEAPHKRWLTDDGKQHHQLTYAIDQMREWRDWFNNPTHRQLFLDYYEVPSLFREREWHPIYVLVYGRRAEDPARVGKLRAHLRTYDQYVIPYEHIKADRDSRFFLCVRNTAHRYEPVTVPANIELEPDLARDWVIVHGKAEAAAANPWISDERKAFLAERFDYWDSWATERARERDWGVITAGDRE